MFSIDREFPPELEGDADTRENFRSLMSSALRGVVRPVLDDVRDKTPYETIAGGWLLWEGNDGEDISVGIGNTDPIWIFREDDTVPHWAPWGEGSALAAWAEAQGIEPFLVARKIAEDGTEGNHILRDAWDAAMPDQADEATQGALYAYVLSWGTED